MRRRTTTLLPAALAALALLPPSAWAGEGVVLITQADALAGGVTPSDTAGFPVTLDTSGSYRLAGSLTVASTSEDGVVITADDVTFDLGGFAIVGPGTCTGEGSTLSCSAGSGRGIESTSTQRVNVRNGSVRGFGAEGVYVLSPDSRLVDLRAEENGDTGIVANGGIVRGCIASRNGNAGIVSGYSASAAVVVGNTAVGNSSRGINANEGSVVFGSSAARNGDAGIKAFRGSSVHRNSSVDNEGDGIWLDGGTLTATLNSLSDNDGYGINAGSSTAAYGHNVIDTHGTSTDTVGPSGDNLGSNVCDGSTSCP